jgi:hypothetical protein
MFKLNTYLSLACLLWAQIDYAADKLLESLRVFDSEELAKFHCQGQLYKRSMRIHDQSMSLFRGHIRSGSLS